MKKRFSKQIGYLGICFEKLIESFVNILVITSSFNVIQKHSIQSQNILWFVVTTQNINSKLDDWRNFFYRFYFLRMFLINLQIFYINLLLPLLFDEFLRNKRDKLRDLGWFDWHRDIINLLHTSSVISLQWGWHKLFSSFTSKNMKMYGQ